MDPFYVLAFICFILAAFGAGFSAGQRHERVFLQQNARRVLKMLDEQRHR